MGNQSVKRSDTKKKYKNGIIMIHDKRSKICQNLPTGIFIEIEVIEKNEDSLFEPFLNTKRGCFGIFRIFTKNT